MNGSLLRFIKFYFKLINYKKKRNIVILICILSYYAYYCIYVLYSSINNTMVLQCGVCFIFLFLV